jgi:hypothetical protein
VDGHKRSCIEPTIITKMDDEAGEIVLQTDVQEGWVADLLGEEAGYPTYGDDRPGEYALFVFSSKAGAEEFLRRGS